LLRLVATSGCSGPKAFSQIARARWQRGLGVAITTALV
jgi:hypothetical protein